MYRAVDVLTPAQVEDLHALYQNEWWTSQRSLDGVQEMLRHTDLVFGFADDDSGKLIAFARVLTDRVYRAFIFDVIVAPAHRGEGLGAALVEHIVSHPLLAKVESFQLTCKPDMMPFYEKYGFRRPEQVFMARSSTS